MGHNSPENFSKIGCSEAKIELGWGWGLKESRHGHITNRNVRDQVFFSSDSDENQCADFIQINILFVNIIGEKFFEFIRQRYDG